MQPNPLLYYPAKSLRVGKENYETGNNFLSTSLDSRCTKNLVPFTLSFNTGNLDHLMFFSVIPNCFVLVVLLPAQVRDKSRDPDGSFSTILMLFALPRKTFFAKTLRIVLFQQRIFPHLI